MSGGGVRKILVTGDRGQLGRGILAEFEGEQVLYGSQLGLDLTDVAGVSRILDAIVPGVIINCAAYTDVDGAERNSELAFLVNAEAVNGMALWSRNNDAHLLHFSTDYVFSGNKQLFEGYTEADLASPVNTYGRSKMLGEQYILSMEDLRYTILRTAWLYSEAGKNFLMTMLRLSAEAAEKQFKVVDDQFGSPTPVTAVARQARAAVDCELYGLYHASSGGYCSWFEFATTAFSMLGVAHSFIPCASDEYPTDAARPKNSILLNEQLTLRNSNLFGDWRDELELFSSAYAAELTDHAGI